MKKLIPLLALLVGVSSSFGQGTVAFNNDVLFATTADRMVYQGAIGGALLKGTNFAVQLYYGADANSLIPVTSAPAKFRPTTTLAPGTWSGATRTLGGFAAGAVATLEVRAWDKISADGLTSYATYEAALAAGQATGTSAPYTYTVPPAGSPSAAFFMEGLRAFAVTVPEPSAIALSLMGVAGLLLIRRRK